MDNKLYDCIIIGSGVAGMTASIYLKRAGYDILVLEKHIPGGQINQTGVIENYPGYVGDGPTLAMNMYEQVKKNEIEIQFLDVYDISKKGNYFEIITKSKKILAKKIILATGRTPNKLNLSLEKELTGRGISYCAICDGPLFKDQEVAVVGSGNSALEEGIYLASICKKVIFINRSEKFKGSKIYMEKLKKLSNIDIRYQTSIENICEKENKLDKLILKTPNGESEIKVAGLFVYIGFTPDTNYVKNIGIQLVDHYVVADTKGKTSVEGIYACGDVVKKDYYQISTAVGEGTTVALEIAKELS